MIKKIKKKEEIHQAKIRYEMKLPELNSIFFPLPPLINLILIECKHDSFENILLNFRL